MEEILRILEQDGRTTPAQIAERLGRPEAEVAQTISRLEKEGVIRRYKTVVNWDKVGQETVFAFIEVKVQPQRGVGFDAVAERIMQYPEVHSLYLMAGDYDLHVVVSGKTMREIAYFVAERLATIEHVQSTATHFVLKSYKVDGDVIETKEEVRRLAVSP